MNIQIPERLRNRILKYLDGDIFNGRPSNKEYDEYIRLKEGAVLEDTTLIEILNKIHSNADLIPVLSSVRNSNYITRVNEIAEKRDKGIQPEEGYLDYDLPKNEQEMQLLAEQLERDFELLDIGKEVLVDEKDRKMLMEEILKSIDFSREKVPLTEEQKKVFEQVKKSLIELSREQHPNASRVEELILLYNEIANSIWADYMKDPSHKIIHMGIIKGEYDKKVMSTSLITDKEVASFSYDGEGVGMLITPKRILAADSKDIGTHNDRENTENVSSRRHPIKLPQQIEEEIIKQTIKKNGENLNYLNNAENQVYSEIALADYEISGYIMIGYGDKSQDNQYIELQNLAGLEGRKFEYIDINQLREKQSLSPICTKTEKVEEIFDPQMLKTQLCKMSRGLKTSVFNETTHSIRNDEQQENNKGRSIDDD